jgi:hypothetical protein
VVVVVFKNVILAVPFVTSCSLLLMSHSFSLNSYNLLLPASIFSCISFKTKPKSQIHSKNIYFFKKIVSTYNTVKEKQLAIETETTVSPGQDEDSTALLKLDFASA